MLYHVTMTRRAGMWWSLLAVLAACVATMWLGLGSTGLSMSEGHRAVPGWEMLANGEWFVTRMFGEIYVRKPPGMMWAIAGMSAVFGESAWSARAVSALACTLMALAAWWFGRRWFESERVGLLAGLAQALTPMLWEAGRSAEIEALHTMGVQFAVLGVIDAAVRRGAWRWSRVVRAAWIVVGIVVAMLAKGPAGLPAVGAAVVAGAWFAGGFGGGERRSAFLRAAVPVVVLTLMVASLIVLRLRSWAEAAGPAVTQGPGEFLWDTAKIGSIVTLPIVGLAVALPGSLAVVAWRRLWSRRTEPDARLVLAFVIGGVVTLLIYTASGVSNPRYVMPGLVFWPLAIAGVLGPALGTIKTRRVVAAVACVLAAGGLAMAIVSDRARAGSGGRGSGEPAGRAIAEAIVAGLPPGSTVEVWADGVVEARPEVLDAMRRHAATLGVTVTPRWSSALLRTFDPPTSVLVLRRVEGEVKEGGEAVGAGREVMWSGKAGPFGCELLGRRAKAESGM